VKFIHTPNYSLQLRAYGTVFLAMMFVILATAATPAFAETRDDPSEQQEIKNPDPLERWNRKIYKFNTKVDRAILKPVAKKYVKHVPVKVRRGIRNFVANLREPTTIINDVLQGKLIQALNDSFRFVLNSTFGLLGIFDVASHLDLPRHKEDFGQTLGKWGLPSGPYLMLPLLGPSTVRDAAGLVPVYMYTDISSGFSDDALLWTVFGARMVDLRSELLSVDRLLESQVDPYVFLRESYTQRRNHEVRDGEPLDNEDEDEFLNEILEQTD
jgi:phospholipid-binding lipoprotein MlaA